MTADTSNLGRRTVLNETGQDIYMSFADLGFVFCLKAQRQILGPDERHIDFLELTHRYKSTTTFY